VDSRGHKLRPQVGSLAGTFGAKAAIGRSQKHINAALDEYGTSLQQSLVPEMDAGRVILAAFSRHPGVVHAGLAIAPGWRAFTKFCRGEMAFPSVVNRPVIGLAISLLARV